MAYKTKAKRLLTVVVLAQGLAPLAAMVYATKAKPALIAEGRVVLVPLSIALIVPQAPKPTIKHIAKTIL
jgi:hypothetical protein